MIFVYGLQAQYQFECGYDLLPLEEAPHPHDSAGYCYNFERSCSRPDYKAFYQDWNSVDTVVIRLNFHFIKTGDYGLNFGPASGNCDTCFNNAGMNGYAVAANMVNQLNEIAKNLWVYEYTYVPDTTLPALDINGVPVPYIQDSRLRFELYEENGEGAVHFHELETYKYINHSVAAPCFDGQIGLLPEIEGQAHYSKYGKRVANVFLYDEWFENEYYGVYNPATMDTVYRRCRSLRGRFYDSGPSIQLTNMWWYWRENGGHADLYYGYVGTLFHEIGHMLGLRHTFDIGTLGIACDATEPSGENYTWNYSTNMMGYNNHQRALSPGQLDMMHNRLYYLKPDWAVTDYTIGNACDKLPGLDTITGNVVWDEDMEVNKDVLVKSGAKLEIRNACIMFGYNVHIHVERGARLIVDQATLKSGCGRVYARKEDMMDGGFDRRWGGIKVMGNAGEEHPVHHNDPIYANSSGRVVLLRSVIEDAKVAVSDNWTLTYSPENWGGYLYAFDTRFTGCFKAVGFMQREKPNNSKIHNCKIDGSLSPNVNSEGITIWSAHGIEIDNNTFEHLSRNAIKTIDGVFTAKGNTFDRIRGIAIDVSSMSPIFNAGVVIGGTSAFDENVFKNNPLGIRIDGYSTTPNLIRYNTFISANLSNQHKAIEAHRSIVEIHNNEFENQYNGIGISTSNMLRTEVRNNSIENFSTGLHYLGSNSRSQFYCNSFEGNQYAGVHVQAYKGIPDQGTVDFSHNNRWRRGSNAVSAVDILAKDTTTVILPDTTAMPVAGERQSFLYYVKENEPPNADRRPQCNLSAPLCSPGLQPSFYRNRDSDENRDCEPIGTFTTVFDHLAIGTINGLLDSLKTYDSLYLYNNDYMLLSGVKYGKISDSLNHLVGLENYTGAGLLLSGENEFEYWVLNYGVKLAQKNLVSAAGLLDEMERAFTEEEVQDYVEVQRINLKHRADYSYIADSTELVVLRDVSGKMSLAASNARAMLTFWTDTLFAPLLDHPVYDSIPPLREEGYAATTEKRITVYPNPGYGLFTLRLALPDHEDYLTKEVRLYDMRGILIDVKRFKAGIRGEIGLDYRHCAPGLYLLETRSERAAERVRLIIMN